MIAMGIGEIIGITVRRLTGYRNKKYLSKLELKYGNIDTDRAIKYDFLCNYIHAGVLILLGLLIRDMMMAMTSIIVVAVLSVIGYYMFRKRYITVNENN